METWSRLKYGKRVCSGVRRSLRKKNATTMVLGLRAKAEMVRVYSLVLQTWSHNAYIYIYAYYIFLEGLKLVIFQDNDLYLTSGKKLDTRLAGSLQVCFSQTIEIPPFCKLRRLAAE